jgi:hypothetical protein
VYLLRILKYENFENSSISLTGDSDGQIPSNLCIFSPVKHICFLFAGRQNVFSIANRTTRKVSVKIAKVVPQPTFGQNYYICVFYCGKAPPNIKATSVFFKELPKVNNRPMGENSPNLVTLISKCQLESQSKPKGLAGPNELTVHFNGDTLKDFLYITYIFSVVSQNKNQQQHEQQRRR